MMWTAPARAEREVSGKVVSMDDSRLVVESPDSGKMRLDTSGRTRVFLEGGIVPVKRLLPGSRVRVVHENGHANTIFVKAVPK